MTPPHKPHPSSLWGNTCVRLCVCENHRRLIFILSLHCCVILVFFFSVDIFVFSVCSSGSLCDPVTLFSCQAGLIAHLYANPSHNPSAVGPLELANALAACCLSTRLSSQHRQWAAQQLVRTLAAHDRDNNQSCPQTFADMAGDLRKCSFIKLEAHQSRVRTLIFIFLI